MIYGYARVSTLGQSRDGNSLEEQTAKLREAGAEEIYIDAFTGTKLDRPNFNKLITSLRCGDTLIACKLDRISRSASQGITLVDSLLSRGVAVNILNMGLMNDTPTGKLIRNIMFSFAEFERDMIVERTREGKAVARTKDGYREGRPKVSVDEVLLGELITKHERGESTVQECCEALGISRSTWYNLSRGA